MASSAQPGTPRHKKKIAKQERKRLALRIKTFKKKPFYAALMKEAKQKLKIDKQRLSEEYDRKLGALKQINNYHFRDATACRIEGKRAQALNRRLVHKVAFADRRLKEKDEQIEHLQDFIKHAPFKKPGEKEWQYAKRVLNHEPVVRS